MKQQEKKSFWKILKIKIREIINMGNSLVSGTVISEGGVSSGPPQGVMGVESGLGGDQISGKWINTRTGQEVWAQRMIDDGNCALVVTDKGIIPMTEFTEYVQVGEEEMGVITPNISQIHDTTNLVSKEDMMMINQISSGTQRTHSLDAPIIPEVFTQVNSPVITPTESQNYAIIDKLFSKFDGLNIKVEIDWGSFPKDKLETLTDIFDVPKSEIAEYIVAKYFNNESIAKEIEETI